MFTVKPRFANLVAINFNMLFAPPRSIEPLYKYTVLCTFLYMCVQERKRFIRYRSIQKMTQFAPPIIIHTDI